MNYGKAFDQADLNLEAVETLDLNIQKLMINRLDAIVGYVPDMLVRLNQLETNTLHYAHEHPLAIHKDALVCKGVAPQFIQSFNDRLMQMKKLGELKKILGESYVE